MIPWGWSLKYADTGSRQFTLFLLLVIINKGVVSTPEVHQSMTSVMFFMDICVDVTSRVAPPIFFAVEEKIKSATFAVHGGLFKVQITIRVYLDSVVLMIHLFHCRNV